MDRSRTKTPPRFFFRIAAREFWALDCCFSKQKAIKNWGILYQIKKREKGTTDLVIVITIDDDQHKCHLLYQNVSSFEHTPSSIKISAFRLDGVHARRKRI